MKKNDLLFYFIIFFICVVWFIYCILHPTVKYVDLPIQERIRHEQRILG